MRSHELRTTRRRYDIAWKLFLETPENLQYLLKQADSELFDQIHWRRGVEYLDNELQ